MRKILFIYSVVVTVSLAFFFAFSNPTKATLIISFLLLPIPAYLFISLTNPKEVSAPKWSLRILVIIFLLSLMALTALKLLNPGGTRVETPPAKLKVKTQTNSPLPVKTESPKGSQDFTDILVEESKKTPEPTMSK